MVGDVLVQVEKPVGVLVPPIQLTHPAAPVVEVPDAEYLYVNVIYPVLHV